MAKTGNGAEISAQGNSTVALVGSEAFADMIANMSAMAQYESAESRFEGDDILSILTAEDEEEMWESDDNGPQNARNLANCELNVTELSFKFSRGSREMETAFVDAEGRRMYAVVTCVRVSEAGKKPHLNLPGIGEVFKFNTSARFVVSKLYWLYAHNKLPRLVTISSTDLGDGTAVLKLKPIATRIGNS